jgi:hypothetical protein
MILYQEEKFKVEKIDGSERWTINPGISLLEARKIYFNYRKSIEKCICSTCPWAHMNHSGNPCTDPKTTEGMCKTKMNCIHHC